MTTCVYMTLWYNLHVRSTLCSQYERQATSGCFTHSVLCQLHAFYYAILLVLYVINHSTLTEMEIYIEWWYMMGHNTFYFLQFESQLFLIWSLWEAFECQGIYQFHHEFSLLFLYVVICNIVSFIVAKVVSIKHTVHK